MPSTINLWCSWKTMWPKKKLPTKNKNGTKAATKTGSKWNPKKMNSSRKKFKSWKQNWLNIKQTTSKSRKNGFKSEKTLKNNLPKKLKITKRPNSNTISLFNSGPNLLLKNQVLLILEVLMIWVRPPAIKIEKRLRHKRKFKFQILQILKMED